MERKKYILLLISFTGFLILFIFFNSEKKEMSDFLKSGKETFLDKYSPIMLEREEYLGKVADTLNHMNAYMNFGEICLPMLDQWNGKIEKGDYVSKKKDSLTLIVERNNKKYYLHFNIKNFDGAPPPCKCKELSKR
ncbi:hypothetical protein [Chryseobacterium sp.]|uniref:hypothetical protein n=1 Tax=Chryseobacterium sp. TaxID=1871047 RepID=UPI002FC68F0C